MSVNLRETELYKTLTTFHAIEIIEGFGDGQGASGDDTLIAWQYIADTGFWRQLQGFYGRTIRDLRQGGVIQ